MPSASEQLASNIERATRAVAAAEADLERLLGDLSLAPRADKTTVSRIVGDALRQLRAAKADLAAVQSVVVPSTG